MISKDLKEIQRILKRNDIQSGDVAVHLSISPGHWSKIINQRKPLTRDNLEAFNKEYGKIVRMDESLIVEEKPALSELVNFSKSKKGYSEITIADLADQISQIRKIAEDFDRRLFSISKRMDLQSLEMAKAINEKFDEVLRSRPPSVELGTVDSKPHQDRRQSGNHGKARK